MCFLYHLTISINLPFACVISNLFVICLDSLIDKDSDSITLTCNHIFHKYCLKNLVRYQCPLCREKISIEIFSGKNIIHANLCECDNYCPFVKNGPCRFCYGMPIKYYLS